MPDSKNKSLWCLGNGRHKHPLCGVPCKRILLIHPSVQLQVNQPGEDFQLQNWIVFSNKSMPDSEYSSSNRQRQPWSILLPDVSLAPFPARAVTFTCNKIWLEMLIVKLPAPTIPRSLWWPWSRLSGHLLPSPIYSTLRSAKGDISPTWPMVWSSCLFTSCTGA